MQGVPGLWDAEFTGIKLEDNAVLRMLQVFFFNVVFHSLTYTHSLTHTHTLSLSHSLTHSLSLTHTHMGRT
jgi:hypothetical protein